MAKRRAAIHAAGGLVAKTSLGHVAVKLVPVLDTFEGRTIQRQFTNKLKKSGGFSHCFAV